MSPFKPWALPFTRLPRALPKQLLVTTSLTCHTRGPDQPLQRPDCRSLPKLLRAPAKRVLNLCFFAPLPGIWYNILRGVGKLAVIINVSDVGTSNGRAATQTGPRLGSWSLPAVLGSPTEGLPPGSAEEWGRVPGLNDTALQPFSTTLGNTLHCAHLGP